MKVLFVCTGNSARSQIAEALLNWKGRGEFDAVSAGVNPAAQVNPFALDVLRENAVPWGGHTPRGLDGLADERWDIVVTVCDHAKESCPIFPGQPVQLHWGLVDPAEVRGSDEAKRTAFRNTFVELDRLIDQLIRRPS